MLSYVLIAFFSHYGQVREGKLAMEMSYDALFTALAIFCPTFFLQKSIFYIYLLKGGVKLERSWDNETFFQADFSNKQTLKMLPFRYPPTVNIEFKKA